MRCTGMWLKNITPRGPTATLNDKLKDLNTKLDIQGKKTKRQKCTKSEMVINNRWVSVLSQTYKTEQQQPHWWNETPWSLNPVQLPRCSAPLGGLPVEEGCVSSEGWEAEACRTSLSPSESGCVRTKSGMAWGSTGCRTCWICRFLAKWGCCVVGVVNQRQIKER